MKKPRAPKWVLYRDKAKLWRWRFRASNGQILADSGESYTRRIDALDGIALLLREGLIYAPPGVQLQAQEGPRQGN